MPIIIKKGSDLAKKKRSKAKLQQNGSDDDEVDTTNIATDMTDVLDFKVYRVIKPNFYNSTTKVSLIGDAYYRDDNGEVQKSLAKEAREEKGTDMEQVKPKVVQPATTTSVSARDLGFADIMARIKESERNTVVVKSGHSITKFLKLPTAEETLGWAIKFALAHGDALVLHVIDLYCQVNEFGASYEGPAKAHLRDRGRTTSDDFHGRDRTQSNFSEDGSPPRGRTESFDASRGRNRTMSSESPSPTRERLPSTDMGSKPTARRTSSRLLSVTGGTDSALGAAGDRAAAAQQGRNKQVSLSQQLENIKVQGTDSFIKAITPQREPIFPYGKRNWKQSTKYPQMDSASTLPLGSPLPGAKGWDGVRKASIMVSASRKLSMLGALTSGNQQGGNGAEAGLGSAAQTQVQPSPRPQVPAPPSAPRPSSASTAGGGGNPRTQQGRSSGVAGRPGVTLSIPAPDRTHSTPPRQSGRAPSSPSSPRQAEPVTPRPPEATASPRSRGHSKGKPEGLIDQSHRILSALLKKTAAAQASLASRIRRAERAGRRVVQLNKDFDARAERADVTAACLFEERGFSRPLSLMHQMQAYDECFGDDCSLGGSVHKDMRVVHEQAAKRTQALYMERLMQHRWFLTLLTKLRSYMKKMNNAVPLCCLQLVVAIEQVLVMGFALTQAMFYAVLEATVVVKEDHLKQIVHQLLKIVRAVVDISATDFLAYLESKDISPNPELINQVRAANRAKRALAAATASASVSATSSMRVTSLVPTPLPSTGTARVELSTVAGSSHSPSFAEETATAADPNLSTPAPTAAQQATDAVVPRPRLSLLASA